MNKVWTEDEKEYIRQHAGILTDAALASELSEISKRPVSLQAARKQRQKMKLRKCHGRGISRLVDEANGVSAKPRGVAIHIKGDSDANGA